MKAGIYISILGLATGGIFSAIFYLFPEYNTNIAKIVIVACLILIVIASVYYIITNKKNLKKIAIIIMIICLLVTMTALVYFFKPDTKKDPDPVPILKKIASEINTIVKENPPPEPGPKDGTPIDFFTLETYSQDTNHIHVDDLYSKANTGEEYGKSMYYLYNGHMTDSSVSSQTYYLNKKYKTFTGTVFLPFQSRSATSPDYPSEFRIYVDNTLAYEAPPFKSGQNPVSFSINVSECTYLEIKMGGSWYDYGTDVISVDLRPIVCLANAEITKKKQQKQ